MPIESFLSDVFLQGQPGLMGVPGPHGPISEMVCTYEDLKGYLKKIIKSHLPFIYFYGIIHCRDPLGNWEVWDKMGLEEQR